MFPEKILCIGVNYANRNEEYKDGSELPKYPSMFFRTPGSFVGSGEPLIRPSVTQQFDYEGEIALVIGKEGRRIAKESAHEHIAGYTLCNEGTSRDWMRHAKFNVTQGKNFDATGSLGPWMVTADEIDPAKPLHLTTKVNGETRQDDTTANLIFTFADLLAYITIFTTLKPGDIIVTGTPVGAGARFDPPKLAQGRRRCGGLGSRDRDAEQSGRGRRLRAAEVSSSLEAFQAAAHCSRNRINASLINTLESLKRALFFLHAAIA